ncbi:MCE family protein [Rhodococcus sp. D2-41]|uniref:MCE family protein n=1 Tax=Speluncibacter jeojiensis TaxID=2710754 RepID=UPI0024101D3B|nr:MCE family protein [Rhodococcus sp. D2-41]MDG3010676.1 MCE family protein [Rhodococcus sp. D2-41]
MRITRRNLAQIALAVVLVALGVSGYLVAVRLQTYTITAEFTSATGIYKGDDVRVVGVKVGSITGIAPDGDRTRVTMRLDRSTHVPAGAKAVIIAQNLVASRFVQLTPAYTGGPALAAGTTIGLDRTAVPVEWDQVKTELSRLVDAMSPHAGDPQGTFGRFLDAAGTAVHGNGATLRGSIDALSATMATLSKGGGDLFDIVRNLQAFAAALSASNEQIVQFQGRLASVTDVLTDGHDQLTQALTDLDGAAGDIRRFVDQNRQGLTEQVQRLADATSILAQKEPAIEKVLHIAPTALVNYYDIYHPAQGSFVGMPALQNFGNPVNFVCGAIAGLAQASADQGAALCAQYLGPLLRTVVMNYPDITINPTTGRGVGPGQTVDSVPGLSGPSGSPPAHGLSNLMAPQAGTR